MKIIVSRISTSDYVQNQQIALKDGKVVCMLVSRIKKA